MIRIILNAFSCVVSLVFLLSLVLPDLVNVILVPVGVMFGGVVFVADCFRKKVFKKSQLLKMFLNMLLLVRLFVLYEMNTCVWVAMILAMLLSVAICAIFSIEYDTLVNESLELNKVKET